MIGLPSLIVIGISFIWWYRRRQRAKAKGPLVPNFVKDRVYLVQFPVSPDVRSVSPFSLKVETWLKLKGIDYENVYTVRFGQKGQIPYVELNGEQIPDSNVIIQKLTVHFQVPPEELSAQQVALGHSVIRMVENHTAQGNFLWRYTNQGSAFLPRYFPWQTPVKQAITKFMFKRGMRLRMHLHGIGRHSDEEIKDFICEDLTAISKLLGDKKYIFGDTMTTTDCSLFGHLAQFHYVKLPEYPHQEFLRDKCPNLVNFVENIEKELWPNWKEECKPESMKNLIM